MRTKIVELICKDLYYKLKSKGMSDDLILITSIACKQSVTNIADQIEENLLKLINDNCDNFIDSLYPKKEEITNMFVKNGKIEKLEKINIGG